MKGTRMRGGCALAVTIGLLLAIGRPGGAVAAGPAIARVAIVGNVRVEEDAIRVHLQSQPGTAFDQDALDKDIRAIYAMGFFDQVTAETATEGKGVVLTFRVHERPLVRGVTIEGAENVKKEEVEQALRVRPHTIVDPEKARQGIEAAKKLYGEKGYLDVDIAYTTTPVGENEVDVTYTIKEGGLVRINEIDFEGNEAFSDRTLNGILQTKEAWIFSFITGAGNLNKDVLKADVERLTAWYYDHGYVTVHVEEPKVERSDDGLKVVIKIEEGEEFKVGKVKIEGKDVTVTTADLAGKLATIEGEVFEASSLRDDVQLLTDRMSEDGYAFAKIEPATNVDTDTKTVDVTFQVERGSPVTVERIEVSGNTKTRDYVVRREMRLQEGELFSGTRLRKSREALQRLGFFQEVNITTRRAAAEDRMNVVVAVKEAQTGAFSAGAGFSSADSLLFNVRIQENNLFGRGQRVVVNADVGSIRRNIVLSFTEPYFRDTPLTVGVDIFDWRLEFDDFARSGRGAGTQVTYPVTAFGYDTLWGLPLDEVRVGADYRIEQAKIGDIDFSASRSIRAEAGTSLVSSITPRVSRNTLNHAFDPTAGSFQDFSVELAGLGGTKFVKMEARERWYYTFLRTKSLGDFTYSLGAALGYGIGNEGLNGDELPLFERYFPGGINSIRGFETRTLGPREVRKNIFGQVVDTTPIGGSQQVILNNEIIFPIVQGIGLKGVVFVDAGNAYSAEEGITIDETRVSAGAGLRWLSPLGPFRIELGKPLVSKEFDEESLVLFSFGGPFQY
jgi:outer membrane protein insertion porin family